MMLGRGRCLLVCFRKPTRGPSARSKSSAYPNAFFICTNIATSPLQMQVRLLQAICQRLEIHILCGTRDDMQACLFRLSLSLSTNSPN